MANIKKPRAERKKAVTFSIKTRHIEDFKDYCHRHNLVFSHTIEELVINFNKKNQEV